MFNNWKKANCFTLKQSSIKLSFSLGAFRRLQCRRGIRQSLHQALFHIDLFLTWKPHAFQEIPHIFQHRDILEGIERLENSMGRHCLHLLYFFSAAPTKIEPGWAFDLCHCKHFNEIQMSELFSVFKLYFARLTYLGWIRLLCWMVSSMVQQNLLWYWHAILRNGCLKVAVM